MKAKTHEFNKYLQNAAGKPASKTTGLFLAACLLSTLTSSAQTKEPARVHIKKIETINGVTKVTDTTYTSTDPASIIIQDGTIDINSLPGGEDGTVRTIIRSKASGKTSVTGDKELDEQISIEIEQALKEAGIDQNMAKTENVIIINGKDPEKEGMTKNVMITKTLVKRIDIKDVDEKELKRLGQNTDKEQKLNLGHMKFYPNPNTGKFNLGFSLPEKGDAEVTILNTEGKVVYTEKLPAFSGNYDREIDISKEAKGIYFVKVEQGKNSQVKKIVLE